MLVEKMIPVEQSKVWGLLESFYKQQGPNAWSQGLVPQGSTANCYIADTYASIVAGFLNDLDRNKIPGNPLIIELGGGNGRFAWQFMQRLTRYHRPLSDQSINFKYLLTDASESNLNAWKTNTRLKQFYESGLMEYGLLRISENSTIKIGNSDLDINSLSDRPVIIIANYLFDSIPAEMYGLKNGQLHQILLTLNQKNDDAKSSGFDNLEPTYHWQTIEKPQTGLDSLDNIINSYKLITSECVAPVPRLGFKFLNHFVERNKPLLMLASDMAFTDPNQFPAEPPLIFDSYFAHYTNFHVFRELFKKYKGGMCTQRHHDPDFCTAAFFLPGQDFSMGTQHFFSTFDTAKLQLVEFSPYDAHEMNDLLKQGTTEPTFRQIFSWLRLSRFDPDVAIQCIHPLLEAIHRSDNNLNKQMLCESYLESYALFFPDNNDSSFDYAIAQLLLAIGFNQHALSLLESSINEFGRKPERLYVYALSLIRLKRMAEAKIILEEVLRQEVPLVAAMRVYEEHFEQTKPKPDNSTQNNFCIRYDDIDINRKALTLFEDKGAVLFQDIFPKTLIDQARDTFMQHFEDFQKSEMGKPNFVGNKRYTFPLRVIKPFNEPAIFANDVLINLLTEHMGQRPIINAYGAVVTYPGANSQHVHREHPLLFIEDQHNIGLPAQAVTVLIPLVNLNESLGGTQFWPGTHKLGAEAVWEGPSTVLYAQKGDALLLDYRTFHGGMPCISGEMRIVIFITYSMPWFRDTLAFESHDALAISEQELNSIREEHRDLFKFARKINHSSKITPSIY
jgi:tetratricopeptide (TPR) repeat protein